MGMPNGIPQRVVPCEREQSDRDSHRLAWLRKVPATVPQ